MKILIDNGACSLRYCVCKNAGKPCCDPTYCKDGIHIECDHFVSINFCGEE